LRDIDLNILIKSRAGLNDYLIDGEIPPAVSMGTSANLRLTPPPPDPSHRLQLQLAAFLPARQRLGGTGQGGRDGDRRDEIPIRIKIGTHLFLGTQVGIQIQRTFDRRTGELNGSLPVQIVLRCCWRFMSNLRFSIILLLVATAAGCSRSGDFGAFVVAEVAKYGGQTVTNAPQTTLPGHWTIKRDANGFQASVKGAPFASVAAVMRQEFGPPKISTAANLNGQPHQVWGAAEIGVAIQLIGRPDGADIICVRGFRDMGEMFKAMELPNGGKQ
jgi:hypothetical protein